MNNIKYIRLLNLINKNANYVEKIKDSYLLLLTELTVTNYVDNITFINNVERINNMGTIIVGYIGEVKNNDFEIIASGTIIIEPKIIRNCKSVGHIEDIVVTKHMRGKNICQTILNMLKNEGIESNCYKMILNCNDEVKNVYVKNGFEEKGIEMSKYLL